MNRRHRKIALTGGLILLLSVLSAQTQDRAEAALKAAMDRESVDGNLRAAIEQYKKLATDPNKSVAARALVRLGEYYEKQGSADARKAYEQVLSRFGDQKEAAERARSRLAALGSSRSVGRQTTSVVWKDKTVTIESAVSPDGRYISYADWGTGNLGFHDLASGADRRLTTAGSWTRGQAAFAEDSAFSRDGKQVAYAWFEHKTAGFELRVTSVAGDGNPRSLFRSAEWKWLSPRDWSPDGRWIAVSLEPENSDVRTGRPVRPGERAALGLVDARDGSLRILKTTEWRGSFGPNTGYSRILFSPDGRHVAYDRPSAETRRHRDVFVLTLGEDRETPVAAGPFQEQLVAWSSDGQHLLFTSDRTGTVGLWAIACANGTPRGEPELIKPEVGPASFVGSSVAGALYYYLPPANDLPRILQADFDYNTGKLLSTPADLPGGGGLEAYTSPDWSSDGKYLAYLSNLGWDSRSLGSSIKIRSTETGEVRELPTKLEGPKLVRWAPDGRSLIVLAGAMGQQTFDSIVRVDIQGGEVSPLIQWEPGFAKAAPAPSPDGKKIYYLRRGIAAPQVAFVEFDLASGKEREIIRSPFLGGLNLSPDGKYIATSGRDTSNQSATFMLIPVDGGVPRDVMRQAMASDNGYPFSLLVWAPDSKSALIRKFLPGPNPSTELWQAFVDGRESRKLDGLLDSRLTTGGIRMHPDGRRIVHWATRGSQKSPSQIMMMENFLPLATAPR